MAEQYLAGHPTVPCTICTRPTAYLGTKLCDGCWHVNRVLAVMVPELLKKPEAAANVRALLEQALKGPPPATPPEPVA